MQRMPQSTVKSERHDPAFLPPSYYQQQKEFQQQRPMAPHTNSTPNQSGVTNQPAKKRDAPHSTIASDSLESQPDFQSIKGVFGWTVVDNVNVPYILRSDKKFVSVRIVELKLLSRYPNSYPDDLGKHAPLTSFFITANEAKLLNEINLKHCDGEYGKKDFNVKELIVLLTDFIKFYELVKKTFPDAAAARAAQVSEGAGWLQIKNTVTPYIRRSDGGKYVPLSVIQYAAGLLTNEKVNGIPPTSSECHMLNEACRKAGVEFVFSDSTTRLIKVSQMLRVAPVDIIELPSNNPLKHATYMELPTTSNVQSIQKQRANTSVQQHVNNPSHQTQPYLFQPNVPLDMIRHQIQENVNRPDNVRQSAPTAPRPPFPGNQMLDTRMMTDPRFAELYRMQYVSQNTNRPSLSNGPPNMSINPMNNQPPSMMRNMTPMMQYYINMQQRAQATEMQGGKGQMQTAQPINQINGADPITRRSPGASSNPSPRSRPPSQSRPPSGPSGSRPPSNSPLSPQPSPLSQPPPYPTGMEGFHPSRTPHNNGQLAIQQMQTMCTQRFPTNSNPPNKHHHVPPGQIGNMPPTSLYTSPVMSPTQPMPNAQVLSPNANQEIPGLFSPTGSSIPTIPGQSNSKPDGPPPLVRMSNPPALMSPNSSVTNGAGINAMKVVPVSSVNGFTVQVHPDKEEPIKPHALSAVPPQNQAPPNQTTLFSCIKGAWLNNKSISCLFIEPDSSNRSGQFCLVEAVCKLYFNGCSVTEFLFALENVLNVPLLICNDAEEKAFIQYYSLPVIELKCNKMIRFEDLEKYFPQLTYMFPSKEAIAQSENDLDQNLPESDVPEPGMNGVMTFEDIEASMPMAVSEMNQKRIAGDQGGPLPKQIRKQGTVIEDDDDAVIILD